MSIEDWNPKEGDTYRFMAGKEIKFIEERDDHTIIITTTDGYELHIICQPDTAVVLVHPERN